MTCETQLCACGCNAPLTTKRQKAFLKGHNRRLLARKRPDDPKGPNPSGICLCGCGQPVPIATECRKGRGTCRLVKGCYVSYIKNHDKRTVERIKNETGLCLCGCGLITPLAKTPRRNHTVGEHRLYYSPGHRLRKVAYVVNSDTCCWEIPAASREKHGYGRIRREGKLWLAHCYYWTEKHGPIPQGMELDHLCEVRYCCNPDHLELVTHEENTRRIYEERRNIPHWSERIEPSRDPAGCWLFPIFQADGYARVWVRKRLVMAHRMFYEAAKSAIPDGLQLDHLCRTRNCVNPEHLEPVTPLENSRRARARHALAQSTGLSVIT